MKREDLTAAYILGRTVDEGECMCWTGHSSAGKFPQMRLDGKLLPVRRVLWERIHGRIMPKHQIGVKDECSDTCIHPDHLVSRTRSKIQKGKPLPEVTKRRISAAKTAQSFLSDADVLAMRMSDRPCNELDRQFGCSPGYASRIRTGRARIGMANPFSGLGAR